MQITVVLSAPNDWNSLQAWRFDSTGKVVRSLSPTSALIYLTLLTAGFSLAVAALSADIVNSGHPSITICFVSFMLGTFAAGMYFEWKNSKAVQALLDGAKSDQST